MFTRVSTEVAADRDIAPGRSLRAAVPILFTLLLMWPAMAGAQMVSESEQLAEMRQRIAELEKEVRVLKAQLMLAQAELKQHKDAAGASSPSTPAAASDTSSATAGASSSSSQPGDAASPSDTDTEKPAPQGRKFQTLLQPLQQLPPDLRPRMGQGWDSYKSDQAKLWFEQTYTGGDTFEGKLTVKTYRHSGRRRNINGETVFVYPVIISVSVPAFDYLGLEFKPSGFSETIYVDAETAQQYEKIDPTIPLRVTGRLTKYVASPDPTSHKRGVLRWKLEDWKIHSPLLAE